MEANPHSTSRDPSSVPALPRPHEIVATLDRTVHGQAAAKRALAFAVYAHGLGNAAVRSGERPAFGRQHVLLIGPTGVGKSLLVRRLGAVLDLPIAIVSATTLVEAGYAGEQVDACVRALLAAAGGDVERARRGIVFVDEIDKIRKASGGIRDVSGEGVQNALLTLLDGIDVRVRGPEPREQVVPTGGILFVCAGAFCGLADIVRRRRGERGGIGFGAAPLLAHAAELAQVETEDLVAFGMIPEFLGRFASVTALEPLDTAALVAILRDCEDSALQRARALCAAHGAELVVSDRALCALAERAAELGIGARALDRVVREVLEPVTWRIVTNDREVARVTVDRGTALGRRPARFELAARRPATVAADTLARLAVTGTGGRTDPPDEAIRARLASVKDRIGWGDTKGSARTWWEAFESQNAGHPSLVLRLAEELLARNATITEFFLSSVDSNTQNIQANLHFLDYTRLKKAEERRKRERDRDDRPGAG